jgi:Raf kinase inhibitor-like YbhB/YbcL family protein
MLSANILIASEFTLSSKDLEGQLSQKQVFNGFGCTGKNISPELSWNYAPKGTKSFAVTVYDKDAATGSGWWHWVVFNINGTTSQLKQNAGNASANLLPKGAIQSITDFGQNSFGGACPPKDDKAHQYLFTVHALNVAKLDLNKNTSPALVGYMLNVHTIKKASIVSYYSR